MQLSKKELRQILKIRNQTMDFINELKECGDVGIAKTHNLDNKISGWKDSLDDILGFRPPKDDEGDPRWYSNHVLKDDPNAWHSEN